MNQIGLQLHAVKSFMSIPAQMLSLFAALLIEGEQGSRYWVNARSPGKCRVWNFSLCLLLLIHLKFADLVSIHFSTFISCLHLADSPDVVMMTIQKHSG
jgi:hypothetical protein